jgi:hypothetical protein
MIPYFSTRHKILAGDKRTSLSCMSWMAMPSKKVLKHRQKVQHVLKSPNLARRYKKG